MLFLLRRDRRSVSLINFLIYIPFKKINRAILRTWMMSGMGGKESAEDTQSDLCNDLSEGETPETIDSFLSAKLQRSVSLINFLIYIPFKKINRAILRTWMMSGMGGKETPPIVRRRNNTGSIDFPFCRRSYEGAVD
jgi:hypothetical protein